MLLQTKKCPGSVTADQGIDRVSAKIAHRFDDTTPAAVCQAPAVARRLANLEMATGLPQQIIIEALIDAADPQLVRVAAAMSPAAVAWRLAEMEKRLS